MLIKGLNHGTGDANAAINYLLGETDHKGEIRGSVDVHSGDPKLTADIANSLEFKNRYWSAIVGFHPDDKPTDEQINELITEINKTLFAGIDEDRISHTWIIHRNQDGHPDLHNVGAKVDLETGKAFNPLPPGWQKSIDPVRDYFNKKYGWKSPDIEQNPKQARLFQPSHEALRNPREAISLNAEDPKTLITAYVMQGIEKGLIESRSDMLDYLKDAGFEINRISNDYITVKDPSLEKNNKWRMKGVLFDDKFTIERAIAAEESRTDERTARADPAAAERIYKQVEKARAKRAEFNQKRYRQASKINESELKTDAVDTVRHEESITDSLVNSSADLDDRNADNLGRNQLADARLERNQSRESTADQRSRRSESMAQQRERESYDLRRSAVRESDGRRIHNKRRRQIYDLQALKNEYANALFDKQIEFKELKYVDREAGFIKFNNGGLLTISDSKVTASGMSNQDAAENVVKSAVAKDWEAVSFNGSDEFIAEATKQALVNGLQVNAKDKHQQKIIERVTNEYNEQQRINAARTVVDESIENSTEAVRRYVDQTKQSRDRSSKIDHSLQQLDQRINVMRQNNNLELDRFKSDINLVEYLASQGFEIDKRESSKNSVIMRDDTDKLVVSTSQSGHGIYFNVHDDSDNGTIIDLVQKHQNKNLGQVRKELRPWIGQRESIPVPHYEKPKHITSDRNKPLKAYLKASSENNDYLKSRGIDSVLNDPRFGNIKTFSDGSAIFPHYDQDGFSGYERKGQDYTGFSSGGEKRLWHSLNVNNAERIVITETAIDALSHAELKRDNDAAYMSFGGSMSPEQQDYLAQVIKEANERGAVIVAATDNDKAGQQFSDFIEQLSERFERDAPGNGNDWNDELKQQQEKRRSRSYGLER